MSLEFNHAGIVVSDIEASTRFYRDLLGFDVVTSYKMPGDWPITYLRSGGGQVELLGRHGVARREGPTDPGDGAGITHIGFKTDDLEGIAARLRDAGVQFKTGPKPAGSGIGRLMFVYDPDFNEVEIIQRDTDW
ncbi:MAG TPA: VOC family protein [Chloroflexota bacterium]|jgi:catechol 2,3-dioxygenase-like lactoylglutathione lyase family enzyme|nr:VOC family protein [Chloroflexota bacterium]